MGVYITWALLIYKYKHIYSVKKKKTLAALLLRARLPISASPFSTERRCDCEPPPPNPVLSPRTQPPTPRMEKMRIELAELLHVVGRPKEKKGSEKTQMQ
ncbi:hypothetical protein ACS0TY_035758 [Phlomoides rotata]